MANELMSQRAYIDPYEAIQVGRQRSAAEAQAAEMARLNEAQRQAAANAMRDGLIDPAAFGNELAQMGYAYAVPGAQKELYALEEQRGKGMKAIGEGIKAGEEGVIAKIGTFKQTLPNNPQDTRRWLAAAYQDPDIGPYVGGFGSLEEAQAAVPNDPAEFQEYRKNAGLFVDKFLDEYTLSAKEEADIETERMKSKQERAAQYSPEIEEVEDPNDPSQILLVDVKRWRGGGIGSPGVIGPKGKAKVEKGEKSGDAFISVIEEMESNYDELNRMKAIPSTKRSASENLRISAETSDLGQMIGRAAGTEPQSLRNQVQSARLRLLQGIKAATGMSAQELNSNVELQQWLDAVTNPANDYESNKAILKSIRQFVEDNKPGKRMAPAAERPAAGVSASERQKAMEWLRKNPNHPRAAEVRKKLGV
jgi:hypothetical protein